MFDIDRILAIPDQSIDYLQMGISGDERAALKDRGFVRKDGIKAKDYMIRTIQKTEKNKAKAEKAIIKGDLKLSMKDDLGKAVKDAEDAYTANPTPDNYRKLDEKTKAYEMGYMLFGTSERWTNAEKNAALIAEKQSKAKPQNTPIAPDTAKKLAITDKKGFQSEGSAAKKIKAAIAQRRPPKASEDLDRNLRLLAKSERELEEANATPYPKEKKGKDVYKNMMDSEARSEIAAMKGRAKDYFKSDAKRVVEDFNRHPSRQAFIKKQYGSLESDTVPRDKKGMIDYLAMAKDFAKSPYAQKSIKSRKVVKGTSPRDRGKFDVNKSLAEIAETKGVKPPSSGFGEISPVQASIGRSNSMSGQPSPMMRENSRRRATERETYKAKLEPIEKEYREKAIKAFENKKISLYDAFAFDDSKRHTDTEGKPTITAWDVLTGELKSKGIETPSPFSLAKLRSKGGEKAVKAKLDELQNQYLERQSKPKQPSPAAKKLNMTDTEYEAFKKKVKRL